MEVCRSPFTSTILYCRSEGVDLDHRKVVGRGDHEVAVVSGLDQLSPVLRLVPRSRDLARSDQGADVRKDSSDRLQMVMKVRVSSGGLRHMPGAIGNLSAICASSLAHTRRDGSWDRQSSAEAVGESPLIDTRMSSCPRVFRRFQSPATSGLAAGDDSARTSRRGGTIQ
jgi:hypothetical protein